jgi:hypothetical protein
MGRTYLSKIPTTSSNPHTIMLLLIVGEFGYPEVDPKNPPTGNAQTMKFMN